MSWDEGVQDRYQERMRQLHPPRSQIYWMLFMAGVAVAAVIIFCIGGSI